ncbi:MAG: IS6 family transposase [Enterococcus italicus]|uniref:IS6 family transposase n=1 Tax=Enterococcus italicus TaxID=246144 RepID=UPI0039962A8E
MDHFKGKQFQEDVKIVAVGYYLRYNLSYREVQEILYDRGIHADGLTLDIWLRKKRDTQAAYAFLKRLNKQFGEPKVLLTDKAPSIGSAFKKLQKNGFYLKTDHRTVKYLNNLIEQDHRPMKRRNKFYQSLRTASATIKGMKTIRGIYKKSRKEGTLFGFSVCTEIKVLLGIPS